MTDATDQAVSLTIQGVEVSIRLVGEAAKNLAALLAAIYRKEHSPEGINKKLSKTGGMVPLERLLLSQDDVSAITLPPDKMNAFVARAKTYHVPLSEHDKTIKGVRSWIVRHMPDDLAHRFAPKLSDYLGALQDQKSADGKVHLLYRLKDAAAVESIMKEMGLAIPKQDKENPENRKEQEGKKKDSRSERGSDDVKDRSDAKSDDGRESIKPILESCAKEAAHINRAVREAREPAAPAQEKA